MVKKKIYEIMEKKKGTKRWYKTRMEYENRSLAGGHCSEMNRTQKDWDFKVRIKK